MLKRILIFILLVMFLNAAQVSTPEYRAMWVTRFELTDPARIPVIVKTAADHNFNALFVQVCGRGTAFYNSEILPKDDSINYDALALMIEEAKKHNIEVHAWVNALYVWSDKKPPVSPKHVVNVHPEWKMICSDEKRAKDKSVFLDPAIPQVRKYVRSIFLEVAEKYDVAGVHFDYIRYPNQYWGFSKYAIKDFEQEQGVDPLALILNKKLSKKLYGEEEYKYLLERWADYRREAVSRIVRETYRDVLAVKPKIKVSAAVISNYEKAYNENFQDWVSWMAQGNIDMIVPMVYDTKNEVIEKQIYFAAQSSQKHDRMVLIGLGAWRRSASDIIASIDYIRTLKETQHFTKVSGVVLFSYDALSKNKNYLEYLKEKIFMNIAPHPAEAELFRQEYKKNTYESLGHYNIIG